MKRRRKVEQAPDRDGLPRFTEWGNAVYCRHRNGDVRYRVVKWIKSHGSITELFVDLAHEENYNLARHIHRGLEYYEYYITCLGNDLPHKEVTNASDSSR